MIRLQGSLWKALMGRALIKLKVKFREVLRAKSGDACKLKL